MGALGRRIFRLPGFTILRSGRVLYIAPSKNIKKNLQSDHGNMNFDSTSREIAPAQFELRAPRQPRFTRIVRNGRDFCSPNSLQPPRVA